MIDGIKQKSLLWPIQYSRPSPHDQKQLKQHVKQYNQTIQQHSNPSNLSRAAAGRGEPKEGEGQRGKPSFTILQCHRLRGVPAVVVPQWGTHLP